MSNEGGKKDANQTLFPPMKDIKNVLTLIICSGLREI